MFVFLLLVVVLIKLPPPPLLLLLFVVVHGSFALSALFGELASGWQQKK